MFYFITGKSDVMASAIELAEAQRLKIFDYLKQPSKIINLEYNYDHFEAADRLDSQDRILNMYHYFQKLPFYLHAREQGLIDEVLQRSGFMIDGNNAYDSRRLRIETNINAYGGLGYFNYFDAYGYLDRRDYYDKCSLTYSEFFDDKKRKTLRIYYDGDGKIKMINHYRPNDDGETVLALIQLWDRGKEYQFSSLEELWGHFLDCVVEDDPNAVFISDRTDKGMAAVSHMTQHVPTYQVFHSVYTVDGHTDSEIFDIYKPFTKTLMSGKLNGLISATDREAADTGKAFKTDHSYGIPVTYLPEKVLNKKVPFDKREPGQLIAVARLTHVKQLDQLIEIVVRLHKTHKNVDLKIYGYSDNDENYAEPQKLRKLVKKHNAIKYIHFCGYQPDLTKVYETAQAEVLTSQYEGFAMAVLEAQGHGCPVISYDINYGPSDIVKDKVSGELIPADDKETLYERLDYLLSNPDKLAEYSANAQKAVSQYSFEKVADKWQKFIDKEGLVKK